MDNEDGDAIKLTWSDRGYLQRALIHPTEAAGVFHPESPIEARLSRLVLDVAPGRDMTAHYVAAKTSHDVSHFVVQAGRERKMPDFLVFPQVSVEGYRIDFVIAVRRLTSEDGTDYAIFAVEADGAEFHARRIPEDIQRQRAIQRATGWPMLRFSGAEIMYATQKVGDVLEAYVETVCPDIDAEPESPRDLARAKLTKLVAKLTQLPGLRHEYVHPAAAEDLDRVRQLLDELREADGRAS